MTLPVCLHEVSSKKSLLTVELPPTDSPTLVTTTRSGAFGQFKSVSITTAGTTTITLPELGGSIVLTDLILTTDKVNAATATVRFTDGTNTINIIAANVTDAPATLP